MIKASLLVEAGLSRGHQRRTVTGGAGSRRTQNDSRDKTMTLVLGLLAPVDLTRHHLPFSGTMMLIGLGAARLTVIDPHDARRLASHYLR